MLELRPGCMSDMPMRHEVGGTAKFHDDTMT